MICNQPFPPVSVAACFPNLMLYVTIYLWKLELVPKWIFLAALQMKNYKEMGLVMAIKAEAIPKFRKKLEELVSEQ